MVGQMHYVYVLKSRKDNKLYIGCTSNLKKRLAEHNTGSVRSTKSRLPFDLIFSGNYESKYDAFNKEKYYKTAKGKKELVEKINNCRFV